MTTSHTGATKHTNAVTALAPSEPSPSFATNEENSANQADSLYRSCAITI